MFTGQFAARTVTSGTTGRSGRGPWGGEEAELFSGSLQLCNVQPDPGQTSFDAS